MPEQVTYKYIDLGNKIGDVKNETFDDSKRLIGMYGTGNSFNLTSLGLITSNTTKGDTCIFSETILGAEDSD